mmetsp:Transcript_121374/g.214039  ORF Transcript_121374/g.214039 Transcript_121374/m.214039 type:complete len:406 (+) Transcript_121374:34-1251(+)
MKFEKGRVSERSGNRNQAWAPQQADTANIGYTDSWKMANWHDSTTAAPDGKHWSSKGDTRKGLRKGTARDKDQSQKQMRSHDNRNSDFGSRKRQKDQRKPAAPIPGTGFRATTPTAPKVAVDCKNVKREDGIMSPSQVSTASGVSSPTSSPITTSPRLDALIALRSCMPNAAINLDKNPTGKQDPAAVLQAGGVPQLHTEIESLMKQSSRSEVETHEFEAGRENHSKRISLSDVLDRCSQESGQPAHMLPGAYSNFDMSAAQHLFSPTVLGTYPQEERHPTTMQVNMPALPDQPFPSQAQPGGPTFVMSAQQTAPPPPYMPGHLFSASPLPPAPTHWPDLAPVGCSPCHQPQVDYGCGAWCPAGLEVSTVAEQQLFHKLHGWTAGVSATEIEDILKAAQPNVYQD